MQVSNPSLELTTLTEGILLFMNLDSPSVNICNRFSHIMILTHTRRTMKSDTLPTTTKIKIIYRHIIPCVCVFVYYESIKRALNTRPIYECRYDERLKTKDEESRRLEYTGFLGELEHLRIKTRLIGEIFASVMGEYVFLK